MNVTHVCVVNFMDFAERMVGNQHEYLLILSEIKVVYFYVIIISEDASLY